MPFAAGTAKQEKEILSFPLEFRIEVDHHRINSDLLFSIFSAPQRKEQQPHFFKILLISQAIDLDSEVKSQAHTLPPRNILSWERSLPSRPLLNATEAPWGQTAAGQRQRGLPGAEPGCHQLPIQPAALQGWALP